MAVKTDFEVKHLLICGIGYLGSRVAEQALQNGMRVTALTRSEEKAEVFRQRGYEMIVADLVQQQWYSKVEGPVDYILNCVSAGGGGIPGYIRAYIEGMHALLHYCADDFSGRLIYTSSTGVYPFTDGEVVTEDTEFEPQSETSKILHAAEGLLRTAGPDGWAILRLAGIYGPNRHYLLNQIMSGEPEMAGAGNAYLNLIRVEDICSAIWGIWSADSSALNTTYNVADNQPALKSEVVEWLALQTGQPVPTLNPDKSIRRRHLPNGKLPNRIISNAKLKASIGWEPEYPTYREGFLNLLPEG